MSVRHSKWVLRLGLPVAGLGIAILCGRSVANAVGILMLTALFMLLVCTTPLGLLYFPIFGLYGLRLSSRKESGMDLRDPDTQFFLMLSVPATLVTVGLFALYFRL